MSYLKETTLEDWAQTEPTPEMLEGDKPDNWNEEHTKLIEKFFEEASTLQVTGMVLDLFGVLERRDKRRAYATLEVLADDLKRREMIMMAKKAADALTKFLEEG